ncbi:MULTISPECIES: 2-oxo-hept-4-ene-1,7-dioate hydratase [unclassified Sphingomonas]|uniref:2-oxo-hept-4-ene-1,7-dioate hydratase n=1 Tax=unclassified Sphingomonas TaxID=196159 RepID=UPI0007018D9B|nr:MULTISPECIES: 2-oxo-hepta-3-ene-1,7-dioic acid hydratase [unclassified Sphingomonas]KQX19133.1 2-oxo-hepta-3-ene-1,7-dioate hydratase [Sphingomonas sp. Root1294]KQY65334.1 2-oxo-hepta-3-ene-1,7-dioate hydratase [Sphingomonas sp. Root50]KRB95371.1 2-oxo-hepta-3-ene-1,7-dioate hydratase [Sphingomonas sp. Root720]
MPLSEAIVVELAERLHRAEQDREQVGHFSADHPAMTIEDGYEIQRAWVRRKIGDGRRLIGHKIGLTSRAMQRSSNIDEPDYGALLDDMLFANNADIPVERFIEPRVEVELAFILKDALSGPDCTIFDVLNATDYVSPAVEIIDARIRRVDPANGATRKVFDTISDNAANAGIVLGGNPVKPDAVDLRWIAALIHRNGVIEDSGVAAAVLGHPAIGVAWLANKLAPWGETLQPGEIILSGSFTAPVFATAGDSFHVDYGPLGSISVRFA